MLPELKVRHRRVQERVEVVSVLGFESLVVGIFGGPSTRAHHVDQFGQGTARPELMELPLGSEGFQRGVIGV